MRPHLTLWAKLGANTYPTDYHPLLFHLIDVGAVAEALWDLVLRDSVRQPVARFFGLSPVRARTWVAFWAAAHDIGKAAPCFQSKGKSQPLVDYLTARGFDFNHGRDTPHATISTNVLNHWFTDRGWGDKVGRRVAVLLGGHHGFFPDSGAWSQLSPATTGAALWPDARADLLDALASLFGVADQPPPPAGDGEDQAVLLLLAGLVTVADWLGSNPQWFPPAGTTEAAFDRVDEAADRVQRYCAGARARARGALRLIGWAPAGDPPPPPGGRLCAFGDLFPFPARPLQERAVEIARSLTGPALVLVEAPMGEGKTEAALYLAHAADRRGGQGCYVALPTMATSNGMFTRFRDFLAAHADGRANLHLLHGQAVLSPAYRELQQLAGAPIYDTDAAPSGVVADAWFAQDKKQAMLAPYGVGTVDQPLLAVLQTRHGFVRLFGLAGKCVILDEVHAYDAYMSTLLERLLEWLAALGCPVVLLSATLPAARRAALVRAYTGRAAESNCPYPRVTVARPSGAVECRTLEVSGRSDQVIHLGWLDESTLADTLREKLAGGGCAAVIRNTVGLAQQTYRALREALAADGVEVELFHARFPFARRQEIERGVLRRYGKEGSGRPGRAVLVATQVIEQSLDLDFDVLVSDVAPIDLILQRAGRLHRHDRGRPPALGRPAVWLIRPAPDGQVPDFGVSEFVYPRYLLLRTCLVLEGRSELRLPKAIEDLVEAVYSPADGTLDVPAAWAPALDEARTRMEREREADADAAADSLILRPVLRRELLSEFNRGLEEEEDPRVHQTRKALTRLADPTLQVVVLFRIDGRLYLDPMDSTPVRPSAPVTLDRLRGYMGNAVSVRHWPTLTYLRDTEVPGSWARHGLLRHCRLCVLDPGGVPVDPRVGLRFDWQVGVTFERPDRRED